MTATLHVHGTATKLRVVDGGSSKLQFSYSQQGMAVELTDLHNVFYVRADKAYWIAKAGTAGASLANRWIKLPGGASHLGASVLGLYTPHTFAMCLAGAVGEYHRDGTTSVDGHPALVVRANGPGDRRLAVAASGPPYPLRVTTTGAQRYEGKIDTCHPNRGSGGHGTLTFSHFNDPPAILKPQHPLNNPSLLTSHSSV